MRSVIEDQLLQLKKIHMDDNVVDKMMQAASKEKLELCVKLVALNTN